MNQAADLYHIIAAGSGWVDRRDRGRLRFDGPDAASFLHALLTNDIQSLASGQRVYAAYLTAQGRMIADLTVCRAPDFLLADVPRPLAPALAARFDQLIFAEDVRVSDVSSATFQITVIGPAATSVLTDLSAGDALVVPGIDIGVPAVDVFGEAESFQGLISRIERAGTVPVPHELYDALRIEAGRPAFGVDMTEDTIPLEAGLLERAISTTKGCYVGQEVIIRILHRGGGRVARRLVRLAFDPSVTAPPPAGSPLAAEGRDVGRVTSSAISPSTARVVGLGYVHRDAAEPGRSVIAHDGGCDLPGTIVGFAG